MIVFHVSEEPDIEVFEPRKFEATGELFVWAIDDKGRVTTWSRAIALA